MRLKADIAARVDAMVTACGLNSASVFFCDRRKSVPELCYLHHNGVSDEAQYIYEHEHVFAEDPFTRVTDSPDRTGRLIRWHDRDLVAAASDAINYRGFLGHYSVEVVGAFVQQLLPSLYLVLGAHCRPGARRTVDVAHGLLEREIQAIAQMVVAQLLQETLASGTGLHLLNDFLKPGAVPPAREPPHLSRRERDIADLVCAGQQNKQVAYALALSEFTVENHLRRIYRKLGVHNRVGMAAALLHTAPSSDGYPSLGAASATT